MLLFVAILLGLPSFVGLMCLLVSRVKGKNAVKVDEEAATVGDGPMKDKRLKKGNHAPVQDLYNKRRAFSNVWCDSCPSVFLLPLLYPNSWGFCGIGCDQCDNL